MPLVEIWMTDLKAGVPTVESFDPVYGEAEHCLALIDLCSRLRKLDPHFTDFPYVQADCALWMGQEKAGEYLHDLDHAMTPDAYDAGHCIEWCRAVLDGHPQLLARLRPLVVLYAHKALAKDPNNADYAGVLKAAEENVTAGSRP
jgi:hypothetical protein